MRVEKYNAVRYLYTLYDFSFRLARFSRLFFPLVAFVHGLNKGGNYVRQSKR